MTVKVAQSGMFLSSALEAGDFIPYFVIENDARKLDIQVKAGKPLLLVFLGSALTAEEVRQALAFKPELPVCFIAKRGLGIADGRLFHDRHVYALFMPGEERCGVFVCNANLQIEYAGRGAEFMQLVRGLPPCGPVQADIPPPVLIVPNVISADLAQRLIAYLDANREQAYRNSGAYKSRSHIHPSPGLELELDDKLCKSLLPEIAKVFYSEVTHRETWKICSYDAAEKGAFGKHRDTIHPHLHRRYALTLVLNDDFEGGGINFPEYSERIVKVPRCTAIVFPGSLYHQVKEIGRGVRYVIVSFFFTEAEARLKADSERYRFRVARDLGHVKLNSLRPLSESGD